MVTDASRTNGWIPEPSTSEVLQRVLNTSVAEQVARKVQMSSDNLRVPKFDASGVDIVPEHGTIPVRDGVLDSVLLEATKWATRYVISVEDERDAVASLIDSYKARWASEFADSLDNAVFGVTGTSVAPGTNVPFLSVYAAATAAGNVTATAGALSYEDLVATFGEIETSGYSDGLVVVAHPSFKMELRNLKDADGNRVVATEGVLGSGVPTIFGHELRFGAGIRTSATATATPAGNPLLIVGPKDHLILGVRDGVESALSDEARWETDEVELKMRARRAFAVGEDSAFHVIEKTAGA